MAEYAFQNYYNDYPSDRYVQQNNQDQEGFSYAKLPNRQRGASMCATTLTPVMEHEVKEQKTKRRFSLDYLLFKKKKEYAFPKTAKRSVTSIDSKDDLSSNPDSRRSSTNSLKVSRAEIAAWVFS